MNMWTRGEGEGEMHWEIRADINTPSCVKQIASGKWLYGTGSSAQCSVMTYKVGRWRGGGRREVQGRGDICKYTCGGLYFAVQGKLTHHCQIIDLILYKIQFNYFGSNDLFACQSIPIAEVYMIAMLNCLPFWIYGTLPWPHIVA